MKFILMGLIKRFTKEAGRSPNPVELTNLKKMAQEMESSEKVIPFPMGGKDKTDFFSTRPDPRVKQPKGAKMDVQRAHENLSGGSNYAQGDTKYNADVLADEIARQRKLIPDDGIADSSDLDFKTKTALYDEAYSYLTGLRMLNKKPKLTETDAEIIARMNKQNKDAVKRLKNKKEKDLGDKLKDFDGDPDAMARGGLAGALAKLKKKYGKKIIQKGKAPKKSEKKKLQDMFREFNRKNKAGGGLAYMLGEPREEMAAGGQALRRLLQFLHKGADKPMKGSEGLKKMKLPKQVKFFAEKQGFNPDQIRINYLEQVLESLKADKKLMKGLEPDSPSAMTGKAKDEMELMADDIFKKQFLSTTQEGRFKDLTPEMIDSSIMELEGILKNLKTKGRKLNADGGRIGFADGGMSRRTFLKIMAALAAFPVVGKLAKTTKVAKNVAPIVTPTAEMPAHFPKLVEKILKEGQVVKKDFVKKTGDVTTYKHPDRPDIELTVEGEGNRIQLDFETDQGMKAGYEFRKGDIIDDPASNMRGKRGPNEFDQGEVKYRSNQDGSYTKDFEEGIDTGTENLDEFAGMGKQKTSKSKTVLADAYDDLAVPDEDLADGGLAGLLGE
jgi:hypothetical protein